MCSGNAYLDISIIIPTLGRLQTSIKLAERLLKLSPSAREIIFVFQDEKEYKEFLKKSLNNNVKAILHSEKSAITARNKGLMFASSEYLAFIDDDCVPKYDDWLQKLISPFENSKEIGLVTGSVEGWQSASGQNFVFKKPFNLIPLLLEPVGKTNFSKSLECKSFAAGNFLISRKLMISLNGFNPKLGSPSLYEEIEFSKRLQKNTKLKIWFSHEATVFHNQLNHGGMRNMNISIDEKFIEKKRLLLYKLVYGEGTLYSISKKAFKLRQILSLFYKKFKS